METALIEQYKALLGQASVGNPKDWGDARKAYFKEQFERLAYEQGGLMEIILYNKWRFEGNPTLESSAVRQGYLQAYGVIEQKINEQYQSFRGDPSNPAFIDAKRRFDDLAIAASENGVNFSDDQRYYVATMLDFMNKHYSYADSYPVHAAMVNTDQFKMQYECNSGTAIHADLLLRSGLFSPDQITLNPFYDHQHVNYNVNGVMIESTSNEVMVKDRSGDMLARSEGMRLRPTGHIPGADFVMDELLQAKNAQFPLGDVHALLWYDANIQENSKGAVVVIDDGAKLLTVLTVSPDSPLYTHMDNLYVGKKNDMDARWLGAANKVVANYNAYASAHNSGEQVTAAEYKARYEADIVNFVDVSKVYRTFALEVGNQGALNRVDKYLDELFLITAEQRQNVINGSTASHESYSTAMDQAPLGVGQLTQENNLVRQ